MSGTLANSLFLLACVAGCVGGLPSGPGNAGPDAHVSSSGSASDASVLVDAASLGDAVPFRCRDIVTTGLDTGHHNPGQDCQNGCHDHGFYLSGTLYSSANGGQPVVGAAITFIDATGATGDMRSGTNGNFWWSLPVTFPVTLIASACPTIDKMTATIPSGQGCNRNGCHTASGGAGRVHLP
jgi:hypothetical protein